MPREVEARKQIFTTRVSISEWKSMPRWKLVAVIVLLMAVAVVAQETPAQSAQREPSASATSSTHERSAAEQNATSSAETSVKERDKSPERQIELKPDASGNVPQEQIRELLKRTAEKDLENDKRLRNYTYVQRQETRPLDKHGQVKKVESETSEILQIYGEQVQRVIAKDDKPLSEKDAKKEEEKIQKIIDKRKNESEEDRRKRQQKEEKDREEGRKFVLEIADAYTFHLIGSETIDGKDTWVLDAEPRPGYEPKSRETKFLTKVKGRLWVDKEDAQWAKIDATMIDTISFGLFLARIHKGTHVLVEQTQINEEVWLPKHVAVHVDAKLALLKSIAADIDLSYRDYKKFRTDTKVTVVGEQ